jgi:hypothetical protein
LTAKAPIILSTRIDYLKSSGNSNFIMMMRYFSYRGYMKTLSFNLVIDI